MRFFKYRIYSYIIVLLQQFLIGGSVTYSTNGYEMTLYKEPNFKIVQLSNGDIEDITDNIDSISYNMTISYTNKLHIVEIIDSLDWNRKIVEFEALNEPVRWINLYNLSPNLSETTIFALHNQIGVEFTDSLSQSELSTFENNYGLDLEEAIPINQYIFTMRDSTSQSPLTLAMIIDSLIITNWAVPIHSIPVIPCVDATYTNQWNLNNTGQIDVNDYHDINAPEAWTITSGVSSIVVGVIDSGVNGNEIIDGSDAHSGFYTGQVLQGYTHGLPTGYGRPIDDNASHGQSVAGIIGSQHNSTDPRGIAPNVKIYPVNLLVSSFEYPVLDNDLSNWGLRQNLRAAWTEADVVNCSWVLEHPLLPYYDPLVEEEIIYGTIYGRGGDIETGTVGLGTIFTWAAGNENILAFPADVTGVISVGGMMHDGTMMPGSPIDTGIDIVGPTASPGNPHGIITQDRAGVDGENSSDWVTGFWGTSAAAPHIAGIVALILSVDPDLTDSQVKNAIYNTAIELDSGSSWDGNGLADAFAALLSLFCSGDVDEDRYEDTDDNGLDSDDTDLIADFILENETPDFGQEELGDDDDDDDIDVVDLVQVVGYINTQNCEDVHLSKSGYESINGVPNGSLTFEISDQLFRSEEICGMISIESNVPVEGLQFEVNYDSSELTLNQLHPTAFTETFITRSNSQQNRFHAVSYNFDGDAIPEGEHEIFQICFQGQLPKGQGVDYIQLTDIVLAANGGIEIQQNNQTTYPESFYLHHAYPNPFNTVTNIDYALPYDNQVMIMVYSLTGQQVITLVNDTQSAGYHHVQWSGTDNSGVPVSSGIYFYHLKADGFEQTQKMLLLK